MLYEDFLKRKANERQEELDGDEPGFSQIRFWKKTVRLLVMDNLPFTTTETAACQSMLHELQKGAKTMSLRQQRRDLLATMKSEVLKLADLLAKHDGYGLECSTLPPTNGSDMIRMVSLLGLRIPEFNAVQQGLRCICHTVNIAVKDMFGRMQCEGFEDEEVAAYVLVIRPVVDDQRYADSDGVEPLEIEHDIIDDPLTTSEGELDDLEHLLRKVRTLVVAIRCSPKRKLALKAFYRMHPELRPLKPQLDIQGRWNSIYLMFSRLLYMKLPLQHLFTEDPKLAHQWPTDRE
ncbi:hypothetical protein FN846DRAFT_896740 [Sphaerosporella brunnea]|uniref:Uncharacterized protein n=1 Tax=Sphaerosporella brunnea TaxID=1250544 RepID=A0A5J5EC14_9PEZI|nr:hypothetical protein FN846DRAFT_896740 [Sphaerosporella brunnea]